MSEINCFVMTVNGPDVVFTSSYIHKVFQIYEDAVGAGMALIRKELNDETLPVKLEKHDDGSATLSASDMIVVIKPVPFVIMTQTLTVA